MKKIISILTIMVLVLAVILPTVAQADSTYSFTLSGTLGQTDLHPGDEVMLNLELKNINMGNLGMNVVEFYLEYDENIFEKVKAEQDDLPGDITGKSNWSITYNDEETASKGHTVAMTMNRNGGIKSDTTIGTIKFKVRSDALSHASSLKPIKLKDIIGNADNEKVYDTDKNISYTISEENEPPLPETISGLSSTASVKVGQTTTLNATSSKGANITWTSSNTSVATVSNSGVVTGVSAGQATITAKGESATATCVVTVTSATVDPTPSNETISISKQTASVKVDETLQLRATSSKGATITWSSSGSDIATVSSTGLVTGKKVGTVTITATGESAIATCQVTVYPKSGSGEDDPSNPTDPSEEIGGELSGDFASAKFNIVQLSDVRNYILTISNVTPKDGHTYYYTVGDGTTPPVFSTDFKQLSYDGINKYLKTEWISKYLEVGKDQYIYIYDRYLDNTQFVNKLVVNKAKLVKPEQKKYTDAFYATAIVNDRTQILFNTPWAQDTVRKVTIKIGKITDSTVLNKLYNKKSDALSSLLTYAKNTEGFYNNTLNSNDEGKTAAGGIILNSGILDKTKLTNGAYYFLYAVVEDENGQYVKTEGVTFSQASVIDMTGSYGLQFFGSEDFVWSEEVKKAAESETDPSKGGKDDTTAGKEIPQTGTNEIIAVAVIAGVALSGVGAFIGYKKSIIK